MFDGTGAAGPEPVNARSLLSNLGSMPIAIRCPIIGKRKWLLNESQSKGFLKFWRNRLSHELEHLAIWVKFMRPEAVRWVSLASRIGLLLL